MVFPSREAPGLEWKSENGRKLRLVVLDCNSERSAHVLEQSMLYDQFDLLDREQSNSDFFSLFHTCATCFELPSNISTLAKTTTLWH